MTRFALVLALALAACTSYSEGPETITIHGGLGGNARMVHKSYAEIKATGKPVRIDGQVVSADAFYAFALPDVCYTENAVWSPHAVSTLGLIPSRKWTEKLTARLPEPLAEWFRGHMAYHDPIGWPEVGAGQLEEIWPEGRC